MARRPQWLTDEIKDLEMIARIAYEPKQSAKFYEDDLDEKEMDSLDRLEGYKLVHMKMGVRGERVILTYTFTRKGKRAYNDILDGFEKSLPDHPRE